MTVLKNTLLEDMTCYFFLGRNNTLENNAISQAAFLFWKNVLVQALRDDAKEMGVHYSDEFMCQESVCIFHQGVAIGLFMFNWYNLSFAADRNIPIFVIIRLLFLINYNNCRIHK